MRAVVVLAAAAALLGGVPALAPTSPLAGGVNLGTPGVGAELQYQAAPGLVLRGGGDWLSYSRDETYSDIPYDGKLKSRTAGLFADWHPGGGAFLVSAGAYFGNRELELRSEPTGNITVGGQTFTPAQIGRLEGEAKLSDVQPFVGLGFDNTFTGGGAWGFKALVGVSFSDDPEVDLRAVGGAFSDQPAVQAAVAQEAADIREDASDYKYYPVVQVGVTRRF